MSRTSRRPGRRSGRTLPAPLAARWQTVRDAITQSPRLVIFLAFFVVCAMGGGVARWDALPLLYIRPAAIIAIGLLVIVAGPWNWQGLRVPFALLTLFAVSIAIQLVPLPPSLWSALPGRAPYLEAAAIANVAQPWRPISLMPYRTTNSLLATLPAFCGLIALAGIPRPQWPVLAKAIMVACCLSALLGVLQYGTGSLYPYDPSDHGLPIGLLANRNHQALMLVIGILLLAQWGMPADSEVGWERLRTDRTVRTRGAIALAMILLLTTVILLTGSRTGLALMLLAVGMVAIAALAGMRSGGKRSPWQWLLIVAPFVMIALAAYMARNSGLVRLNESIGKLGEDLRLLALPTVWQMAWHYLPTGAGFGTFDRLFMQFEPDFLLRRTFFNRAHSDPLEVAITGGIPSLTIVAAFLLWFAHRAIRAFLPVRDGRRARRAVSLARTAALGITFALIASLVDYPLRTPLLSLVFVLLCGLCYRDASTTAAGFDEPRRTAL